jgi:two-component system, cell cycle sensor histidine kinase and response regulator CckA
VNEPSYQIREKETAQFGQESSAKIWEHNKLFRTTFHRAGVGMAIVDRQGRYIDSNAAMQKMLGYTAEELASLAFTDVIHPDEVKIASELVQELFTDKRESYHTDRRYLKKDGNILWGRLTVFGISEDANAPEFIITMMEDITEGKQAQSALRDSEERFRLFMDHSPTIGWIKDDHGRYEYISKTAEERYRINAKKIIGKTDARLFPQVAEQLGENDQAVLSSGHAIQFTEEIIEPGGKLSYWLNSKFRFQDSTGKHYLAGIGLDITEQKRNEAALQASERKFRNIFDNCSDPIFIHDKLGQIVEANEVACRQLGYSRDELLQMTWLEIEPSDFFKLPERIQYLEYHDKISFESVHRRKDGSEFSVDISSRKIEFENLICILSVVRDITDRKQVLKALKESEEKYRLTFNSTPDAVNINRLYDGLFVDMNQGFSQMTGYTREEVIGKTSLEVEIWHDPLDRRKLVDTLRINGSCECLEARFKRKDGSFGIGLMSARTFFLDDSPHIISITRDITYHKLAEAEREKLLSAINQVGESVVITDATGIIEYINPAFEKITGYTKAETIGKNPSLLNSGKQDRAFYQNLWIKITGGNTFCGRMINRRKDGTFFTEDTTISPVHDQDGKIVNFVAVKRDITAQLDLEEQYLQAQKMETVGRLAGGIAHDFNNKLGIILGYAELALHETVSQPNRDYLLQIQQATQHSAALTRQLLAFARKQPISPKVLDLNQTVDGMLKMLRRLIGSDINLNWLPGANLWPVRMDPSQIDQIMANLSVNSRDAIDGVGKIDIGTQNASINEDFCATNTGSLPGDYVLLTFSDNGCGMSKEARDHLFEPFYTTKSVGKGTGLGLATIYGIVLQNKGFISVNSKLGKGTIFSIYLPRHLGENGSHQVQDPHELMLQGNETILLIEDELSLLNLGKQILEKNGYGVLSSSSPIDAIRLAEQYCGKIHLLITDVIMPEMNGREVADRLLMVFPDLQIIFMSGYTAEIIARQGFINQNLNFIQKPYSAKELTAKVREVLDRKSATDC